MKQHGDTKWMPGLQDFDGTILCEKSILLQLKEFKSKWTKRNIKRNWTMAPVGIKCKTQNEEGV